MRQFYMAWPPDKICQTLSGKSPTSEIWPTISAASIALTPTNPIPPAGHPFWARVFPLPWSAYVRLLAVKEDSARAFSETDLEEALINHLADFLLELGDDFTFLARQRRMRVDDSWFRVDLVLFHRTLRCLVLVDLKLGRYSYTDAGQMTLYLNYARHNWTKPDENPPVGLILCAGKGADEARYSLQGLTSPVLAAEYRLVLPAEDILTSELARTRAELETRARHGTNDPE